jgi:molecular chaperone GrpE (heat shock protein)
MTVGAVGFGPAWTMEDSMAASIVRLEQENEELRATVAMLQEQARILAEERNEAQRRLREMEDQRDFAMGVIKRLEREGIEN